MGMKMEDLKEFEQRHFRRLIAEGVKLPEASAAVNMASKFIKDFLDSLEQFEPETDKVKDAAKMLVLNTLATNLAVGLGIRDIIEQMEAAAAAAKESEDDAAVR